MRLYARALGFVVLGAILVLALVIGIRMPAPAPGPNTAQIRLVFVGSPVPVHPVSCRTLPGELQVDVGTMVGLSCPAHTSVSVSVWSRFGEIFSGQSVEIEPAAHGGVDIVARQPGSVVIDVGRRTMTIIVRPPR